MSEPTSDLPYLYLLNLTDKQLAQRVDDIRLAYPEGAYDVAATKATLAEAMRRLRWSKEMGTATPEMTIENYVKAVTGFPS